LTTAERLTAIEESIARVLALVGAQNNRLEALETGEKVDETIHPIDAEVGDYVGDKGFYITDIEQGESAVLSVWVDWPTFLEAAGDKITRR
jgi:hypothetical protein